MADVQRLQSAEFMVRTLRGTDHEALLARPESGIIYEGRQECFIIEPNDRQQQDLNHDVIYEPCLQARDELVATANKYRRKLKQPTFDISTKHSWTEVEISIQSVCEELEECTSSKKDPTSKLKRGFNWLCKHGGAGETLANMIPNDSFNSVLCGGLKAVSLGLRSAWEHRQEVFTAVEELPFILKDQAMLGELWKFDEELHRRTATLYTSIFHLLNHILLWLCKNPFINGIKLVVDPKGFSDKLKELKAEVHLAATKLGGWALNLSFKDQRVMDKKLDFNTALALEALSRISALQETANFLQETNRASDVRFLADLLKGKTKRRIKARKTPSFTHRDLLDRFEYNSDLVIHDCLALQKPLVKRTHSPNRSPCDMTRIKALYDNPQLRAWQMVNNSSLLLLNGRAEPKYNSEVSCYSAAIFGALMRQFEGREEENDKKAVIVPLAFFFGQHRNRSDVYACPEEVGMSLMLQLIDRYGDGIDTDVLSDVYERLDPKNIASICSSLHSLITSLKSNVVLVLILDAVRHFAEPSERGEKTRNLVECLVEIYRKRPAVTLKVLIANPTRVEFIEDFFQEDEMVNIPRNLRPRGSSSRLSLNDIAKVVEDT